jgi:hypothetical protein
MLQTYVSSVSNWMLHMLLGLYPHVSSVCFKCFICFYTYVVSVSSGRCKVFLDVAYVAMPIHACFNRMFHLFQTYVANVSSACFKSRSWCCKARPMAGGQRPAGAALSLLLGRSRGSSHVGFPCGHRAARGGMGPVTDAILGVGWDAGCDILSGHPDARPSDKRD